MAAGGILGLAWRHSQWAAMRHAAAAGNIANINTPGYRAQEIEPFETMVARMQGTVARTHERHLEAANAHLVPETDEADARHAVHSGNTVNLEQQLAASGAAQQAYSFDTTVVKAFHRMVMAGIRT